MGLEALLHAQITSQVGFVVIRIHSYYYVHPFGRCYVAGVCVRLLVKIYKQHSGEQAGGAETTSAGASDLEKMTKASTALGAGSVASFSDYGPGWIRSHSVSLLFLCTLF